MNANDIVNIDNDAARNVTDKYIQQVNNDLFARGQHLNLALAKFRTFLDLPEIPPTWQIVLQTAAAGLPLLCPEIFLGQYLAKSAQAIERELAIAAALGDKTAKAIRGFNAGKEAIIKAQDVAEKRKSRSELLEQWKQGPGAGQLTALDGAETILKTLIDSARLAYNNWVDAKDAIHVEYACRSAFPTLRTSETLQAMAERLLTPPPLLGDNELQEVEWLYLYQTIRGWACSSVTIDARRYEYYGGTAGQWIYSRNGLNDNQATHLSQWFGVKTVRGKIFNCPPILDVDSTFLAWGARIGKTSFETQNFGRGRGAH